jgi:hypothetical protein
MRATAHQSHLAILGVQGHGPRAVRQREGELLEPLVRGGAVGKQLAGQHLRQGAHLERRGVGLHRGGVVTSRDGLVAVGLEPARLLQGGRQLRRLLGAGQRHHRAQQRLGAGRRRRAALGQQAQRRKRSVAAARVEGRLRLYPGAPARRLDARVGVHRRGGGRQGARVVRPAEQRLGTRRVHHLAVGHVLRRRLELGHCGLEADALRCRGSGGAGRRHVVAQRSECGHQQGFLAV